MLVTQVAIADANTLHVGLNDAEMAQALGISARTVERHWAYAKVWLMPP